MDYSEFVGLSDAVFQPTQKERGASEVLLEFLNARTIESIPEKLRGHQSVGEMRNLMSMLSASGITNAVFDPTLMRGFDYYTDIVFEVFDIHPDNNRSMFGGGRYDGLVGLFGVEPVPTIGFGMGDVTMMNFLEAHKLLPPLNPSVDVYVILIGNVYAGAQGVLEKLRSEGLKVAVDMSGRKADKQIKTAVKKSIPYAIFIGEKELSDEQYVVKNLNTGEDSRNSAERIVSIIKDIRSSA